MVAVSTVSTVSTVSVWLTEAPTARMATASVVASRLPYLSSDRTTTVPTFCFIAVGNNPETHTCTIRLPQYSSASRSVESAATRPIMEKVRSNFSYRRGYTLVIGRLSGCEAGVIFALKRQKARSPPSIPAPIPGPEPFFLSSTDQLRTYTLAQPRVKSQPASEVAEKFVVHL
ncbi:hypothetical protein K449DRAFT_131277 [Hypoxylon sp. EC38]|nr:hypothetical protein K449DRAFT_131277 [Hypoxylon sp. EC38]